MTTPLVYIFAAVAALLGLSFLAAGVLAYRHARGRRRYADELADYITESGSRLRDRGDDDAEKIAKKRRHVAHITIGDLIRDEDLAGAVTRGITARRRRAPSDG